jgi:hypothetical protein
VGEYQVTVCGGVSSDCVISMRYDLECLMLYSNSLLYIKKLLIK